VTCSYLGQQQLVYWA